MLEKIRISRLLFTVAFSAVLFQSCSDMGKSNNLAVDSASIHQSVPDSPVLPPQEALSSFKIEEGFSIELVASDPLISDPVAIDFDASGRIWIVELNGYMPDLEGNGEDIPNGKIKILSDENEDGIMDNSQIFKDSLVLPRAIRLVYDGILWAVPPNLYFSEIKDDKPANTMVVDTAYAVGGNVEHQPNGLMVGMDNWIYSAKSTKRYKRKNGEWLVENTEFRGQWGITMDDYGRILYNDNSNQLRGDYYPPGIVSDAGLRNAAGVGIQVVEDQSVYPSRTNTGINRGYLPDMLTDSLKLTRFTAASGPVVFRSMNWGESFEGNAFVPEPAGNLIKRNILFDGTNGLEGKQAYKGREFLTSTDERFRPVNLNVGPDGNLYVIDFYRGLIQHKTYVSDYLREEVNRRNLDSPIGLGRIYRIKSSKRLSGYNDFVLDDNHLIDGLKSQNGWVRDWAQRAIIQSEDLSLKNQLVTLLESENEKVSIHALWTLEGLNLLEVGHINSIFSKGSKYQIINGLLAAKSILNKRNGDQILSLAAEVQQENKTTILINLYLLDFLNSCREHNEIASLSLIHKIYLENKESIYIRELVNISVGERTANTLDLFGDSRLLKEYRELFEAIPLEKVNVRGKGYKIYTNICSQCHGSAGEGVKSLAPPLIGSEWIGEEKERLIKAVLFGLEGPITVKGKLYKKPEITELMPALNANTELSRENLVALFNYLLSSYSNSKEVVTAEDIGRVLEEYSTQTTPFKASDLQ